MNVIVYSYENEDGSVYVKMVDIGEEKCILIDEVYPDWDAVQEMIDNL